MRYSREKCPESTSLVRYTCRRPGWFRSLGRQILTTALSVCILLPGLVHSIERPFQEEVNFRQNITTPAGTALRGFVDLTLRSDGTYKAHFHMRATGLLDYDFVTRAMFVASNGTAFALQHSGHAEGTESTTLTSSPRRNSDKHITGSHQFIKDNWPAVKAGRMSVSKDYSKAGVIGFIEDMSKVFLDIAKVAAKGAVGAVIALGDEMKQAFESLEQSGTIGVIAGVAVLASGGTVVMALTTGVQAGLMTKALIEDRQITEEEYKFANVVFKGTLPPAQRIWLTNLEGLGGRAFVMPGVGEKIYVNIGAHAFKRPMTHVRSKDDNPGRLFIHELTHVWQIHNRSFVPGWVCSGLISQIGHTFGDAYEYRSKGFISWSEFNIEQQGALVDEWFGRREIRRADGMLPEDINDPYFRYIHQDVRRDKSPIRQVSTPPYISASPAIFATPFHPTGVVPLIWDAGPRHPYAELWVNANGRDALFLKQPTGSIAVNVERGRRYIYILRDTNGVIAAVDFTAH